MMKPKLYIMCGLPYAGKSTYAQKLVSEKGYVSVGIDDIRESLGFFWGGREADANDWQKIFNMADKAIIAGLQSGKSVIYDTANQDKASRIRIKQLASQAGYESEILFFDTPIKVILERRQDNLDNPTRSHIPQAAFDSAIATFEPPTEDEGILQLVAS